MVCEGGDKWPYNYCFVCCSFQDLFKTVCSIFVQLPSSFSFKQSPSGESIQYCWKRGNSGNLMVILLDYSLEVSEFELQSYYYVTFWTNTIGKDIETLYPPSYWLNSTPTVLLQEWYNVAWCRENKSSASRFKRPSFITGNVQACESGCVFPTHRFAGVCVCVGVVAVATYFITSPSFPIVLLVWSASHMNEIV